VARVQREISENRVRVTAATTKCESRPARGSPRSSPLPKPLNDLLTERCGAGGSTMNGFTYDVLWSEADHQLASST
jgi:hypothetical protein